MGAADSVSPRLYADASSLPGRAVPANPRGIVRTGMAGLEAAMDHITAIISVQAGWWIESVLHGGRDQVSLHDRGVFSVAAGLLLLWLLERDGAYRSDGSLLRIRRTERVLRVTAQAACFLFPLGLLAGRIFLCETFVFGLLLLPVLLMLQKTILDRFLRRLHLREAGVHRAVIYGAGDAGRRIVSALLQAHRLRLHPVAIVDHEPARDRDLLVEMGYRRVHSVPVQSGRVSATLLQSLGCNLLIVVMQSLSAQEISAAEEAAARAGVRIASLCGPELREPLQTQLIDLDGLTLTSAGAASGQVVPSFVKRCFDVIVSSVLLVIFAPLLALIAVLVRLDSSGPALFRQKRVGANGELFSIFKFRSMYLDAPEYERSPVTSRDPRITRVGRLLRRSSLDELPQLLNVFRGEMSLVGPRPEMPFIAQKYSAEQRQRLQVTPGLTGLWQLSADRAFPIHEALEYDLYYIRNRGFFMDLAILIHTLFFAARGGV
jgi:exopolysaccharide biosynthesis polyprenyl glycosylphosphotransferase